MTRKKFFILTIVLVLPLLLTGCLNKPKPIEQTKDGSYQYSNDLLKFSLTLPSEFQYFQTQRKSKEGIEDLEIFIPTSDTAYPQEVPGYGKPLIVRVYDSKNYKQEGEFEKVAENKDRIYAIEFWQKKPKDWEQRWNKDIENKIINSFTKID